MTLYPHPARDRRSTGLLGGLFYRFPWLTRYAVEKLLQPPPHPQPMPGPTPPPPGMMGVSGLLAPVAGAVVSAKLALFVHEPARELAHGLPRSCGCMRCTRTRPPHWSSVRTAVFKGTHGCTPTFGCA